LPPNLQQRNRKGPKTAAAPHRINTLNPKTRQNPNGKISSRNLKTASRSSYHRPAYTSCVHAQINHLMYRHRQTYMGSPEKFKPTQVAQKVTNKISCNHPKQIRYPQRNNIAENKSTPPTLQHKLKTTSQLKLIKRANNSKLLPNQNYPTKPAANPNSELQPQNLVEKLFRTCEKTRIQATGTFYRPRQPIKNPKMPQLMLKCAIKNRATGNRPNVHKKATNWENASEKKNHKASSHKINGTAALNQRKSFAELNCPHPANEQKNKHTIPQGTGGLLHKTTHLMNSMITSKRPNTTHQSDRTLLETTPKNI